ncbi:beta-lactamase [Colletotrichum costaricense]|uniref:Beta-lactamase n=1 Tax=Colletotrichum costaricense TaxID=1209916 RepID=A0AAI9YMB2_9PEZI|nr:beta-lactamase [Colletotrichum costaricense]KAK1515974.1 beta-lactamase [Colletotrichum costaricense]
MTAKVKGFCDDKFASVQVLLQEYLDNGEEHGASIAVNIGGKDVVDIWGGFTQKEGNAPWKQHTIVNVFSSSKTVISLAALMLIDRGIISPFAKVSEYWPEFGTNGKENIEVRHILSHTSGVSGWDAAMTMEDVYDIPKATALLAEQQPWWEPGTAFGYQAITMGHLIGEIVLRTTGKSLGTFIRDEIAIPLKADFQLGALEMDWHRVAEIIPPPTDAPPISDVGSFGKKATTNPPIQAQIANTPGWRLAELGASNGHATAKGLARILSVVSLGGEVDGVRLLSPKTIDLIFREQILGRDLVFGDQTSFGMGFALTARGTIADWLPEGRVCFWGGWGGSIVIADQTRGVTIAYTMNKMENAGLANYRTKKYVEAVYDAINASGP